MYNVNTYYKKFTYCATFAFVLIFLLSIFLFPKPKLVCFAENNEEIYEEFDDNINQILDDIDSSELDDYLSNDFNLDFFDKLSFKELVLSVLQGNNFSEYSSLTAGIVSIFKENILNLLSFFLSLFAIVILFEIFNNFCYWWNSNTRSYNI